MPDVELKPRFTLDGEPYRAGKLETCSDCYSSPPEGTIMRFALPMHQTEKTQEFQSLDGRDLSIDLRARLCPRCVVLNDMNRPRKDKKEGAIATSKPSPADLAKKKKTKVKKRKNVLPEEEEL